VPEPPDLAKRVISAIADNKRISPDRITPASTFQELDIDSLDAVNIAFALEEEFKISIPDDDLRLLKTVQDAIDGVRTQLQKAEGTAA
jgi:acyl carrier protein